MPTPDTAPTLTTGQIWEGLDRLNQDLRKRFAAIPDPSQVPWQKAIDLLLASLHNPAIPEWARADLATKNAARGAVPTREKLEHLLQEWVDVFKSLAGGTDWQSTFGTFTQVVQCLGLPADGLVGCYYQFNGSTLCANMLESQCLLLPGVPGPLC